MLKKTPWQAFFLEQEVMPKFLGVDREPKGLLALANKSKKPWGCVRTESSALQSDPLHLIRIMPA